MSDTTPPAQAPVTSDAHTDHVVPVTRRRIDWLLIALGGVATIVFAVAGGLLLWGSNFASDWVHDELSAQKIVFPSADALAEEGREDLAEWGGEQVTTGDGAEAYASYIAGHLEKIADGQTYAELSGPEREAKAAVQEAVDSGASQDEIDALQADADAITAQRDSLFKGETLRGLLLTAFAWATVGEIAGIAAIVAFVAAVLMLVLVVLGVVHVSRMAPAPKSKT